MSTKRKFLFDRTFEGAQEPLPAKPQRRFAEADLTAARGEGLEAGYLAGFEAAMAQGAEAAAAAEVRAEEALLRVAAALQSLDDAQAGAVERLRAEAAGLALAAARKLAPALIDDQPTAEIEALFAQCLSNLSGEPRLVVRVADPLVDDLSQRLERIVRQAGQKAELVLLADAALAGGDCRIEWADGGAERDLDALDRQLGELVARYCQARLQASAPPEEPFPDLPEPSAEAAADDAPAPQE